MIPDLRNTKESPGHSPVTYRKMVGIFCFLLKIHPCRRLVRRLLLLFLGRDGGCAIALLRTVTAEPGVTAAVNDRFGSVLRKIYAVGFVLFAVQYAVLAAVGGIDPQAAVGQVCVVVVADVNAECDSDGQQNSQQAEEHSEGKRFFLLVLHRTPLFYKHFPQSLQPLQIDLLPQVSQFARK